MKAKRRMLAALACCAALDAGAAVFDAIVRTPDGKPLGDVALVLEPVAGKVPAPKAGAKIEQRDREFVPYLTIVQKDTAIDFPNRDRIKHHVYSFSPAKIFEIKLYAGQPVKPVVFDKPGEVALGCNIHDWMEAHVLVVDTPWFAKTGTDGVGRVGPVPAGTYRLRLWHPRQKAAAEARLVSLGAASQPRLELALDVAPRVPRPKPPADLDDY